MSFAVLPPEINSHGCSSARGWGRCWTQRPPGRVGQRARFGRTCGLIGDVWPAQRLMAGPRVGRDGGCRHTLFGMADRDGGAGRCRCYSGAGSRGRIEAALVASVHPQIISANRNAFVQLVLSNWLGQNGAGDRRGRGAVRADVGPERLRDVRLLFGGFGGRSGVDAIRPDSGPARRRQPGQRGGVGDRRDRRTQLPQPGLVELR